MKTINYTIKCENVEKREKLKRAILILKSKHGGNAIDAIIKAAENL